MRSVDAAIGSPKANQYVIPVKAGIPTGLGRNKQKKRDPRFRGDDAMELFVGGLGLQLNIVLKAHPGDHVELLLKRVDMLFLILEYLAE